MNVKSMTSCLSQLNIKEDTRKLLKVYYSTLSDISSEKHIMSEDIIRLNEMNFRHGFVESNSIYDGTHDYISDL